jgi:hypothetical protein
LPNKPASRRRSGSTASNEILELARAVTTLAVAIDRHAEVIKTSAVAAHNIQAPGTAHQSLQQCILNALGLKTSDLKKKLINIGFQGNSFPSQVIYDACKGGVCFSMSPAQYDQKVPPGGAANDMTLRQVIDLLGS